MNEILGGPNNELDS
jgi:hypothetical protein